MGGKTCMKGVFNKPSLYKGRQRRKFSQQISFRKQVKATLWLPLFVLWVQFKKNINNSYIANVYSIDKFTC